MNQSVVRQKLIQSGAVKPNNIQNSMRNTNKQASRFAAVLARRMELGTAYVNIQRKVVV